LSRYVSYRDFDWLLLALVLLICALGVVEIYSATLNTKFMGVHIKQIYWILGGVALMFVMSMISYQALIERVPIFYVAAIASLLAVAVFGKKYLGARRWVDAGLFHFQPSEWIKLVLILAIAKYFADLKGDCEPQDIVKAGTLVGIPMLMVLAQPDLGTALTYLPIAIMGLFLGGMKGKHALVILLFAALLAPAGWHVLKPYQRDRLTTFMEPEADPQRKGYQLIQSLVAVGAGGISAKVRRREARPKGNSFPSRIRTSSSPPSPRNTVS
jgi:rod shape determining protein RodA